MYRHEDIWTAIDRLAASFGYSPSGLAKKAGLDPTTFNKSKRFSAEGKPRWPSTESIAKILGVTGATMSEFISLIDGQDNVKSHTHTLQAKDKIAIKTKDGKLAEGYFIKDLENNVEIAASPSSDARRIPKSNIEWVARIMAV